MLALSELENLYSYAASNSNNINPLLDSLERETFIEHAQPHMLSGFVQGRLLSLLSRLKSPYCILEIGTYTGYSALCLAEGLAPNGVLHTLELDAEKETICKKYFAQSIYANQIHLHIGNALQSLERLQLQPDLVFIDADKTNYINYYNAVIDSVPVGGIIIADNVLFHGQVLQDVKGKNAQAVDAYNKYVLQEERTNTIILPIRDGISISTKIK